MTPELTLDMQLDLALRLLESVENFTKRRLRLPPSRYQLPDDPDEGKSEDLS